MPERSGQSDAEARAERDFLLARLTNPGSEWIGQSSNALTIAAMTGRGMPPSNHWPSDKWDLGRCEVTLARAPEHLKDAMRPIIARWARHVAEGGLYCRGCDNSIGHHSIRNELCGGCRNAP